MASRMHYDDSFITARYREAKDKSEQIKILSELNSCDISEVIEVLLRWNVKVSYDKKLNMYLRDEERAKQRLKPVEPKVRKRRTRKANKETKKCEDKVACVAS